MNLEIKNLEIFFVIQTKTFTAKHPEEFMSGFFLPKFIWTFLFFIFAWSNKSTIYCRASMSTTSTQKFVGRLFTFSMISVISQSVIFVFSTIPSGVPEMKSHELHNFIRKDLKLFYFKFPTMITSTLRNYRAIHFEFLSKFCKHFHHLILCCETWYPK